MFWWALLQGRVKIMMQSAYAGWENTQLGDKEMPIDAFYMEHSSGLAELGHVQS